MPAALAATDEFDCNGDRTKSLRKCEPGSTQVVEKESSVRRVSFPRADDDFDPFSFQLLERSL
jgi:hypothetical protein